jgi:TPR repeat protein
MSQPLTPAINLTPLTSTAQTDAVLVNTTDSTSSSSVNPTPSLRNTQTPPSPLGNTNAAAGVDNVVAVKWFTKAVEQGSSDAQCFLGDMYAKGLGVIKDEVKAANLISMAAKQGHPEAQAYLGDMYWSGQGVKQDTEQAIHWLRLAAKQGQDGAADKLEEILESERKNSLTKPRSKSN